MIRCLKTHQLSQTVPDCGWEGMAWKETGNSYKETCQTKVVFKTDEKRQEEHQSTLNKIEKKNWNRSVPRPEKEKKKLDCCRRGRWREKRNSMKEKETALR